MKSYRVLLYYTKDLQNIAPVKQEDINWHKSIIEKEAGFIYTKSTLNKALPVNSPVKNLYTDGMLNSCPDRNLEQSLAYPKDQQIKS